MQNRTLVVLLNIGLVSVFRGIVVVTSERQMCSKARTASVFLDLPVDYNQNLVRNRSFPIPGEQGTRL